MNHYRISVFVCFTVLFGAISANKADESKPLWLAVARPGLAEGIAPLADHRRSNGFDVAVSTETVEKALANSPRRPDYLLFVGDDQSDSESANWFLPSKRLRLYRWRRVQREEFASDASWGDVDADSMPELPVGRIPARSREEVDIVVKKILAYENQPPSEQDLRFLMWGGSPGYGATFDSMATSLLLAQLQTKAPKWIGPWVISSDPNHALCGWPPDQAAIFTNQMKQGGVFNILMGHGSETHFSSMDHLDKRVWFSADDAKVELAQGEPTPPLIVFTCNSGNFTAVDHCLTESFLFFPGGPVATIGATTESHPLTNFFTGEALLKAIQGKNNRLGDVWLDAQRSAQTARNFIIEQSLKDVEGKLEAQIDVAQLRRDQMLMYAILGDPATRLRIPKPLMVKVERTDAQWTWTVERPEGTASLSISACPTAPKMPPAAKLTDQKKANELLEAANAQYSFEPQETRTADEVWTGTTKHQGWLRFVAVGREDNFVATVRIND